jgi:uncharacterized protein DUF4265
MQVLSGRLQLIIHPLDESGQRGFHEVLPAEPLGRGVFRLLASPGLVEGVAAGDELELAPADPTGYRILRRGGRLCIWVYVPEPPPEETEARLRRAAAALGGYLDGGNTRLRILTVPVSAGFGRVEAELAAVLADLCGSTWAYGNVYDHRNGGRPLGWWDVPA